MTIDQIKRPIAAQSDEYELRLKGWLKSDYGFVEGILNYVIENRGKGIRPLLVLLSHALNGGEQSEKTQERAYLAAMLIEMIHTASLLHDDVIDEAYMRRGKPSVNALWRSKAAILAGDFILARSYTVGLESGNGDVVTYITKAMGALCEGELIQSDQSERLEMNRQIYIDIIDKKTASLIAASSASGALAAGADEATVETLRVYGENLGIAFQIKDDLLDYSSSDKIGKPVCGDLREKKITLPLLTVLEKSSEHERRRLLKLLADVRSTPANVDTLYGVVLESQGIEQAEQIMWQYAAKAKNALAEFPNSEVKQALIDLCDFVCLRDK